jgi:SHOCT-like protein
MTTQTDDTRRILDMLSQGKITVDDADRLLKALNAAQPAEATATETAADDPRRTRWVRINVHKPANEHHREKDVNIRVPIAVVKGGMRLGAIIATFAGENAAQRMKARGIDLDLSKINGDLSKMNGAEFDAFLKSLDDTNIEIDDGRSQVRITCE